MAADPEAYLEWTARWLEAAMATAGAGRPALLLWPSSASANHVMLHLMSRAACSWQFHDLIIWDRVVGYNERRDSFTHPLRDDPGAAA